MSQSGPSGLLVNVNNGREAAIRCGSTLVQVHSSNGRFDVTLVDAPPLFLRSLIIGLLMPEGKVFAIQPTQISVYRNLHTNAA